MTSQQELFNRDTAITLTKLTARTDALSSLAEELADGQKEHDNRIGAIAAELKSIKYALYLVAFATLSEHPPVSGLITIITKMVGI
jgi:hypothetical protein